MHRLGMSVCVLITLLSLITSIVSPIVLIRYCIQLTYIFLLRCRSKCGSRIAAPNTSARSKKRSRPLASRTTSPGRPASPRTTRTTSGRTTSPRPHSRTTGPWSRQKVHRNHQRWRHWLRDDRYLLINCEVTKAYPIEQLHPKRCTQMAPLAK